MANQDGSFEDLVKILDVASAMRQQRELVSVELNRDQIEEDLKKRMRAAAAARGETLSETDLSSAIDSFYDDRYAFVPPKKGFSYKLATGYINRETIANRVGRITILGSAAASLTVGVLFMIGAIGDYVDAKAESKVEDRFAAACASLAPLRNSVELLESRVPGPDLQRGYLVQVQSARDRLESAVQQSAGCEGDIKQLVGKDNRALYTTAAGNLENMVADAQVSVGTANTINAIQRSYLSASGIAIEPAAKTLVEDAYSAAKARVESGQSAAIQESAAELSNLEAALSQEYTVTIVNRKGEKSGIDRYFTDENGKRISGFYLIVEAKDRQGNVLAVPITSSEESDKTATVKVWGERVPEAVYEQVKNDKLDNGIIERDVVATKDRGYLSWTIKMPGMQGREGQILSW